VYVKVAGRWGAQGVVSYRRPGDYAVRITADDHAGQIESRSLPLHVRDCGGSFQYVNVEPMPIASRLDTYGITARAVFARPECQSDTVVLDTRCASKAPPGEKLRYDWDFGDGQEASTLEPYVEHDYSMRPQESVESAFLVRVTVTSASQGELKGVASLNLSNLAYRNKTIGHVITVDGFADGVMKKDSAYTFAAHFLNHEGTTLRFDKAKVQMVPCDEPTAPVTFDVAARQVLDDVDVPPGKSATTGSLRFAGDTYCRAIVTLQGHAPGSLPVQTVLGTMLKPRNPTRVLDSKDPAAQPELQRTLTALALLHRNPNGGTVTSEEISALERRGLLE